MTWKRGHIIDSLLMINISQRINCFPLSQNNRVTIISCQSKSNQLEEAIVIYSKSLLLLLLLFFSLLMINEFSSNGNIVTLFHIFFIVATFDFPDFFLFHFLFCFVKKKDDDNNCIVFFYYFVTISKESEIDKCLKVLKSQKKI